ncbi:kinesin-like protein KIF3C isoform X1 [Tachysurus ichikawai]
MESKLLVGGKNIIDHTNEQQKMLEIKRQEIAEQTRKEREMQQQMLIQDEETVELRETFTSLQQEVEAKTKKLKKCEYGALTDCGSGDDLFCPHCNTSDLSLTAA